MSMPTTAVAPDRVGHEARVWTRAAYRALPEGPPIFALEEGELFEVVRPTGRHQKILAKLLAALMPHIEQNDLGEVWPEVEVDITLTRTYIPDLCFLAKENLERFADDIAIKGAPDLVVEILPPSTAVRDKSTKLQTYQEAGVPWYWLVESDTLLIYEYKNTPEGYLLTAVVAAPHSFSPKLFPGLTLHLADLMGETSVEEDQHE